MIVLRLREAVIAELKRLLPGVHVASHGGTFDENELKRWAVKSPALLVAVPDVGGIAVQGRTSIAEVGMGLALVTGTGKKGIAAEAVALSLVPSVLTAIAGQRWNLPGVDGPPENLKAQNLYSAKLDAGYAALWGISFRQSVELGAGLLSADELAGLDDFLSVNLVQADDDDEAAVLTDDTFNVRTGAPESK